MLLECSVFISKNFSPAFSSAEKLLSSLQHHSPRPSISNLPDFCHHFQPSAPPPDISQLPVHPAFPFVSCFPAVYPAILPILLLTCSGGISSPPLLATYPHYSSASPEPPPLLRSIHPSYQVWNTLDIHHMVCSSLHGSWDLLEPLTFTLKLLSSCLDLVSFDHLWIYQRTPCPPSQITMTTRNLHPCSDPYNLRLLLHPSVFFLANPA